MKIVLSLIKNVFIELVMIQFRMAGLVDLGLILEKGGDSRGESLHASTYPFLQ